MGSSENFWALYRKGVMLGSIHVFLSCYTMMRVTQMAARTNLLMQRDSA